MDKLVESAIEPRCIVKLCRDFFTAVSVSAVFVKVSVLVGVGGRMRRAVSAVLDLDCCPPFLVTKIRARPHIPMILPNGDRFEDLVVLLICDSVIHLMFEVIRNTIQVEAIRWEQKVVAR